MVYLQNEYPALFYGTGIPACVLVINKKDANQRDNVLFINADREYKEGKNQNSLRPENIEKITHVYHKKLAVTKYSRLIPFSELEKNEHEYLSKLKSIKKALMQDLLTGKVRVKPDKPEDTES